jgi:hypothetical protein
MRLKLCVRVLAFVQGLVFQKLADFRTSVSHVEAFLFIFQ